ncbi:polyphosphate polymerase domain-containing protein [Pseudoalteromonas spongiae]|uniref:Polyphosphate polymerase domain-containing protein n=1 Tax=Pseudoalteromonas spongiae TaxID=298657 RepID=A0ABU8EVH6_9GAMM
MNLQQRDYRFEVKVPVPLNRLQEVYIWLMAHSMMFREHFAPRDINSLYLDTPFLARFEENLSGISTRKKVRIRWYGELHHAHQAKLEFKHRQGGKGFKVTFDTALQFENPDFSWLYALKSAYQSLPVNAQYLWDTEHSPIIICRYRREYYISGDESIRATFDSNIESYDQRYRQQANLTRAAALGDYVLLELKTNADNEAALSDLLATCPLRPSRHSKYVNCIRHLMWQ